MKLTGDRFAILLMVLPWLNPFAPGPSPAAVPWLISLACAVIVLLVISLHSPQGVPEMAARSLVIASLASAVIGVIQYFGIADALTPWVNAASTGEAFANLRQRNQFASLTNIGLVVLLCWARPSTATPSSATRLFAITQPAAAGLLMVANATSSSRTGLLELFAVVLMAVYGGALRQPQARRIVFSAIFAYGAATIALPLLAGFDPGTVGIVARFQDGGSPCASRLILWSNVLHLISLKPWFGWGWGGLDYAHFITLYPGSRFCEIADNAHNLPLHLAVELGVPFALMTCGSLAWLVWKNKPWRERDNSRQMAWGVTAIIGLHSLLEYPLWYGPFQLALGLCVWILLTNPSASAGKCLARASSHQLLFGMASLPIRGLRWGVIFLAVATLSVAGWAALDYLRVSQIYLPPVQRMADYRTNTLEKIGKTRFFQRQLQFAKLMTTTLTADNAVHVNALAYELLSFSPEARVAEKLIDSAMMLGQADKAAFFDARFQAAYPEAHQRWVAQRHPGDSGLGNKVP